MSEEKGERGQKLKTRTKTNYFQIVPSFLSLLAFFFSYFFLTFFGSSPLLPRCDVETKCYQLVQQGTRPGISEGNGALDEIDNDARGIDVDQDHHIKATEQS